MKRLARSLLLGTLALLALPVPAAQAADPASACLVQFAERLAERSSSTANPLDWSSLPPKINLRDEIDALRVNFVPQGDRNSCTVFSTTSALELEWRRLGYDIDLSEQYILWAVHDSGADPSRGLRFEELERGLVRHRMCREELMPYKSLDQIIPPSEPAAKEAETMPGVKVREIVPFDRRIGMSVSDIFAVCQELSRMQPVCLAAEWDEQGGKLSRDNVLQDGAVDAGHMIMLTGYELSPSTPGEGFFHFRNSWGLVWGDYGYAKMPFSYARRHAVGAAAFRVDWSKSPRWEKTVAAETGKQVHGPISPGDSGFTLFLAISAAGGLALLLLILWLVVRLFAPGATTVSGVLGYLASFLVLYGVMIWCASSLAFNAGGGNFRWLLYMLLALVGLCTTWFRMTRRKFELTPLKTLGVMAIVAVGWNAVWFGLECFAYPQSYRDWDAAMAGSTPAQWMRVLAANEEERTAFLQNSERKPQGTQTALTNWMRDWETELDGEKRRLNPNNKLASYYYGVRRAAFDQRKQALVASSAAGAGPVMSAGAGIPKEGAPTRVETLYRELNSERAKLDPKDTAAVRRFNEKVAEYNQLRTGKP